MSKQLLPRGVGITVTALLALVLSVAGHSHPVPVSRASAPPEEPGAPSIELHIEPDVIPPGECATLLWNVHDASALVFLDGEEIPPVGEKRVCPDQTTTYHVIADAPGTPATEEVTLHVGEGPAPFFFRVIDPEAIPRGSCARLVWELPPDFDDDWSAFLEGEPIKRMGDRAICPEETTTYHLVVEAPDGPREFELTLRVAGLGGEVSPGGKPRPEEPDGEFPIDFGAEPDAIPMGECASLFWRVPEGEWTVIVDGQPVPTSGEAQVCPEGTRPYQLTVEGPGWARSAAVTIHVGEGAPPEPQASPQPTAPQAPPQPTPQQPQPGAGLGVDVTPTDLYPDNQPQGTVWVRITNNGPGALSNNRVEVSGSGSASPLSGGGSQPLSFTAQEFTLTLAPGQTQTINLGWPIDTSKYSYVFNVIVKVKDFTDPNSANNGYQEQLAGSTQPQPQQPKPGPGGKGADIAVTDLYPKTQPAGKVWTRITNNGPDALNNAQVELKCGGTGVDANGKTGWSHVESPKIKTINLKPGQTADIETDVSIDTGKYTYELWCAAWPKSFSDPDQNNNKFTEKIAAQGAPSPPVPPGGGSWGVTKADLAVTDLFPQNLPKGAVMMRVVNHGPQAVGNVDVETTCSATIHGWTQGSPISTANQVFKIKAGLDPGQQGEYYTGIDVDTQQHWYEITCSVKPPFNDANSANNSYQETIPPPP